MIKNLVVDKSMNLIKELDKYDDTQLEEIKYGIEASYIGITKVITILLLSACLGIFKQTFTFFLFFNLLRFTGFGLHASKSIWCWISSIISFIGLPFISMHIEMPNICYIILPIICIICFILYAPADTIKRPLINKKKRKIYKIITTILGIIYLIAINLINNILLKNTLTFALILQTILILPITYKIFKLSYNNYLNYN